MLNFGGLGCYANIYTNLTLPELNQELPCVKAPLYISDNPCTCLSPYLCCRGVGEAGKRSLANCKDCAPGHRCLSVALNNLFNLPRLQSICLLQVETICPTPPGCYWDEGICHHHQKTQMCACHTESTSCLFSRLGHKGSLSRSSRGGHTTSHSARTGLYRW